VGAAALIAIAAALALLAAGCVAGRAIEVRHRASVRAREKALAAMPAVTFRQIPGAWAVDDTGVVAGSVVMSLDCFHRVLALLRALVGGRVTSYETLLDRARREAILRCKELARARGFQAVVNLRLETAPARRAHAAVEVLAIGTGLELRRDPC
jgi:uncharacterized protein YbjQ (UPF0145 family)